MRWWLLLASLLCLCCDATEDSLGYDDPPSAVGAGGATATGVYPSPFSELLGVSQADIDAKLEAAFQQLFHGNPTTQAIYYPVSADEAYVLDVLHGDVRTDGIGYALMLAVELDHRDEFDRVWSWARTTMTLGDGPFAGLPAWHCATTGGNCATTPDANGQSYITTALLFAEARWGGTYGDEARAQLALFPGLLDPASDLVDYGPGAGFTAPAFQHPAFQEVWAHVDVDHRLAWRAAAAASRGLLQSAANPTTGLSPNQSGFDGTPSATDGVFGPDAYRVALNVALDHVWFGIDPWEITECDRLLTFFAAQGIDTYGAGYSLDGQLTVTAAYRSTALQAMNGAAALCATIPERTAFVQAVWNLAMPTGQYRYYDGILTLMSLLALSGEYRVYVQP